MTEMFMDNKQQLVKDIDDIDIDISDEDVKLVKKVKLNKKQFKIRLLSETP